MNPENINHKQETPIMEPTTIHPVIMMVPPEERTLKRRDKVDSLRRWARKALAQSAEYSGLTLGALEKGEHGAPLPSNGVYWSLSHKDNYVAAVTARHPIGIDVEKRRPFLPALYDRLAGPQEWAMAPDVDEKLFFRYWTAKEAVLKAVGKGFTGLAHCRIHKILDDSHLSVVYDTTQWTVTQYWFDKEHIVAVTTDDVKIEWHHLK